MTVACARPTPTVARPTPPEPSETSTPTAPPATTQPAETPLATPPATPTTTPVTGSASTYCLYVDPDHRVVRCYATREDCERQIEFNKGLVAGNQTCEAAAEAHCFDENGKNELCYPTAADCDAMVAKMRKRNRPASQCTSKRGP